MGTTYPIRHFKTLSIGSPLYSTGIVRLVCCNFSPIVSSWGCECVYSQPNPACQRCPASLPRLPTPTQHIYQVHPTQHIPTKSTHPTYLPSPPTQHTKSSPNPSPTLTMCSLLPGLPVCLSLPYVCSAWPDPLTLTLTLTLTSTSSQTMPSCVCVLVRMQPKCTCASG